MKVAAEQNTEALVAVYQEAVGHAQDVGKIDWPNPITPAFVDDLIRTDELYYFAEEGQVLGAAKLSAAPDERIWGADDSATLYLAKLATSDRARGQNYFRQTMLPAISEHAGPNTPLRLDCLADNIRLQNFYGRLGFVSLGNARFFSEKQHRSIEVTRFERPAAGRTSGMIGQTEVNR